MFTTPSFRGFFTPSLYYTFALRLCENSNMAFSAPRPLFDEKSQSNARLDKKILSR